MQIPSSPYFPTYAAQGQGPPPMVQERFQSVISQLFQYVRICFLWQIQHSSQSHNVLAKILTSVLLLLLSSCRGSYDVVEQLMMIWLMS